MPEPKYQDLIDHDLIAKAIEDHKAAVARRDGKAAELATAREAHQTAQIASADAIDGIGDTDPLEAEKRLELASRAFHVADRVHTSAAKAATLADQDVLEARGVAWRPVYLAGVRRRIDAARAGDAARAALAAADAEHAAGSRMLEDAVTSGTGGVHSVHVSPRYFGTEEYERKLWSDNMFDPDTGKYFHWTERT